MFETLELQYLNKLVEGEIRDFASPEPFHRIKVERLGGNRIKTSTQVGRRFPVPVKPLVSNLAVKPRELTDSTPPIVRTFDLTTDGFIEGSELVQGVFQGVWVLDLLTRVECQIGIHAGFDLGIDQIHSLYYIVYPYAFTCSGQHFFGDIICNDIEPKRSNAVAKNLDITDSPVPITVVMIQDISADKDELLFIRIPFFERDTDSALRKFVACLKLRRTVFASLLELRGTDTSPTSTFFQPSKEPLVADMDTDNHLIQGITRDPCPMLMGTFKQLRQVRLKTIPTGIFPVDTIIPFLQCKQVVMHITQIIEHIAQTHILWMLAYLIFIVSHRVTSYQSLTPT